MAWELPENRMTRTLPKISKPIKKDELKSGDIILNPGVHVVIFDKWTSNESARYWAYEDTPNKTVYHPIKYPYGSRQGYAPYRYVHIEDAISQPSKGPCRCPENTFNLEKYRSLASVYCGHQLSGACSQNDLYICYFLNNYNNNEGKLTLFQTCVNGCTIPNYSQPYCNSETNPKSNNTVRALDLGPEWDQIDSESDTDTDPENDAWNGATITTPPKNLSLILYGILLIILNIMADYF